MTCKEILPQISVDGIAIKQQEAKGAAFPNSFSPDADEIYELTVSHTNLVQIDDFLGAFSLNDVLDATVGPSSFYNIKFLVTNDPDRYKAITSAIRFVEEVSFFLHGGSQTATPKEVIKEKKKIESGTSNAPATTKSAAEELNKCAFKATQKQQDKASTQPKQQGTAPQEEQQPDEPATPSTAPTPKQVEKTVDEIINALTSNRASSLRPKKHKIASWTKPLEVEQKEIGMKGDPLTPTFINSDVTKYKFSATQLKNLYMVIIPNVEYIENNQLVFTIRQYAPIILVRDFEPSAGIEVDLLEQKPVFDSTRLMMFNALEDWLGEKELKTYTQNLKPKAIVSKPEVSLGHNKEVNGVFFLNIKNLAESLTTYWGLLEQPELYKQVLQSVSIKKVYEDGTEKQLSDPQTLNGLSYQKNMIRGYRFIDEYDLQNFDYVISVDAKNPLEFFLKYVIPKLETAKKVVDDLDSALIEAKQTKSTMILNPVSGYFTDDFLNSSFYAGYNQKYSQSYSTLISLYNFMLPGDPIPAKIKKLIEVQQILDLQELYVYTIGRMKEIADTEGISIVGQSSFSSKRKAAKKLEPYKTLTQKFAKPYKATTSPVFFDFLYADKPSTAGGELRSGYEVNPQDIASRADLETQLLNNFALKGAKNDYTAGEHLSITPLSITMDQVTINLIQPLTEEAEEELATRTLMSAELEVKDPNHTFDKKADVMAKLLELEGTKVVSTSSKILFSSGDPDNFIPADMKSAIPTSKSGTKITFLEKALALAASKFNEKAEKELAEMAAKTLFLDEADESLFFLANQALAKLGFFAGPAIDPKHSFIQEGDLPKYSALTPQTKSAQNVLVMLKAVELIKAYYKKNPALFMTRFMNSYQLEYVTGVDHNFVVTYAPLTKTVIGELPDGEAKLVRMRVKAGVPISNKYTELHSSFLLTRNVAPLPTFSTYNFLPNLVITPTKIISPSAVKVEQVSKVESVKTAKVFESPVGGNDLVMPGFTPTPPKSKAPPPKPKTTPPSGIASRNKQVTFAFNKKAQKLPSGGPDFGGQL